MSDVDTVAQAHDLRYGLAQTEADVRTADNKMVQLIGQGRRSGMDSNFNLNQADLIKAKKLLEDKLGVPKAWFASNGRDAKTAERYRLVSEQVERTTTTGIGRLGTTNT